MFVIFQMEVYFFIETLIPNKNKLQYFFHNR